MPLQASAQQRSAAAAAMLEEVVVTARRREESLQDLPLSVAAITADAMQAQGVYAIEDISEHIPNLVLTSTDRRGIQALFIRGIGNDSTNNLTPVGAGLYIDGHYMPNTLGQMMSTLDIERIEVLRGPQGTLFGKNTTGGAVNIITAKPGPEFEGSALVRFADYGQQDFRGMLNVPFSDTVYGRFSASSEQSDGFYYNRTLGRDVGAIDVSAFAGSLRFVPNENWLIDVHYRVNQQRDDNSPGQCGARPTQAQVDNLYHGGQPVELTVNDGLGGPDFTYMHPGFLWDGPVYADEGIGPNDGVGQWGGDFGDNGTLGGVPVFNDDGDQTIDVGGHLERLYPGATIDYWTDCETDRAMGDYVTSYEKETFVDLDNTTYGTSIQWDSNGEIGALDNLNIKVNISHHEVDYDYLQDRDFSSRKVDAIGTPPPGGFGQQQANDQIEVLFTGDVSERLDFVVGAHFFDDEWQVGAGNCLALANANLAALSDPNSGFEIDCEADGGTQFDRLADRMVGGGPGVAGMSGLVGQESEAVFAHFTYDLSDNWQMDFGARYTSETRSFNQAEIDVPGALCTHRFPGDPAPNQQCVPTYTLSYDTLLVDGFYNNVSADFSETTPMISFTRTLESGNIIYFRYAEGFLSGSFNDELNPINVPAIAPLLAYEPEHVYNYEVGFKGTFSDGNVSIAGDVFFMDYEDKQESISIDNTNGLYGGDPNIGITTNAATVDIYGIELELRAVPWDGGFVSVDVGYLKNEYGAFSSFDPDAQGGSVDLTGLRIADYSPEWTIQLGVEHEFQLGSGATLRPQLGMYYQSEYDWIGGVGEDLGNSFCFQDAYSKFRARLTYVPAAGSWEASLFGQNITDERYLDRCNDGRRSGAYDYRYGRPQTWGAEFVYRFGSNI
jgi:iron complex outermembrane receptor protein